jgi:hypothetical protein
MLVVVAHPDDETFGTGSVIAHEARHGVQVVVCCATRGEAGEAPDWLADGQDLGAVRERELRDAAVALGADRVVLLDFADSGMTGDLAANTLAGAPFDWTVVRSLLAQWFDELERVRPDSGHLELDLDRDGLGRPIEDISTILDTSDVLDIRNRASALHRSQVPPFDSMTEDLRNNFLTRDHLVRVQPPWPGGEVEGSLGGHDL